MSKVAVFVDAGYLFAQGSISISGKMQPRSLLDINETAALTELTSIASEGAWRGVAPRLLV
jgi:hypothetical protein